MATTCTIQIVNCTKDFLSGSSDYKYQMTAWSFGNTPQLNYNSYNVGFASKTNDQDDEGKATFTNSTQSIWQLQGESRKGSAHYLQAMILGTGSTLVVATSGTGTITNPLDPTLVSWNVLNGGNVMLPIGTINTNGQYMGLGLVDLAVLFSGNDVQTYYNAIKAGTLTNLQQAALVSAVKGVYAATEKVSSL